MKMTLRISTLILTTMLAAPLLSSAQSDVESIFDDLNDFEPAPAATPAISMPRPDPAETTIQMPAQETPVVYAVESGGEASTTPAMQKTPSAPLDVEKTLSLGKEAYVDDDWNGAQSLFEAVLAADPYNKSAIKWLRRIAIKKNGIEIKSYDATRTRMLENVQAAWNTPKSEGQPPESTEAAREPTEAELRIEALRTKLENIQIPAIAFQDADIQQVVLELTALCRKLDGEGKGANLVVFGTSETILPPITFSGTDLSALETLDIITQISGMKYEIGPSMVSLTPVNYEPPQQMVPAEFDIMPSVGSKMAAMTDDGTLTGSSGLIDVRGFFSTVPFPPGSSAQYNPEFNILLVRNVPKYISKVDALLGRYNQKALDERSRQVEIETKFIEVAEGALDELGFEWTFGTAGEYINNDTIAVPGGQKLFTDTLRSGEDAFGRSVSTAGRATSFNSLGRAVTDMTGDGLIGTAGELLIQRVKDDLPIDLVIRALERQAGSDLLSAPKILTKSGETASIHVGEVHWFPTAYDMVIERYTQPSLVPLDYAEEKTGVMLEVTPELDPENGTIDMKLSPEIRELAGFDEQHVSTLWPLFSSGGTSANPFDIITENLTGSDLEDILSSEVGAADRLIARRPVFKTRTVETTVTIEDGSTIAMGGLIKERLETFKDSVPILGRIPLLGRLFRSEGERTVKRNLIIFVTANQVDATGHRQVAK